MAVEGTVTYVRVPQNAGNVVTSCGNISFSKPSLLYGVTDKVKSTKFLSHFLRNFLHPLIFSPTPPLSRSLSLSLSLLLSNSILLIVE